MFEKKYQLQVIQCAFCWMTIKWREFDKHFYGVQSKSSHTNRFMCFPSLRPYARWQLRWFCGKMSIWNELWRHHFPQEGKICVLFPCWYYSTHINRVKCQKNMVINWRKQHQKPNPATSRGWEYGNCLIKSLGITSRRDHKPGLN